MLHFPKDFQKEQHQIIPNAFQWRPIKENKTFISVVGGGQGLYGDGKDTFEIMIDYDVIGWLSEHEINERLKEIEE